MATTIILADWTKTKANGTPYKKQPAHPAVKFEKLLKTQKIKFKKTFQRYCDAPKLFVNETSHCSWGKDPIENNLFNCTTEDNAAVFVFEY